jgi:hypothetical protein
VAAALADTLGAREVSFLIADFSGQSLTRLSHVSHAQSDGQASRERWEAVPLAGTPYGRALAEQRIEINDQDAGTWLVAPVTSRGEAVGVLELRLDERPDERALAAVADAAHALAYVVIANLSLERDTLHLSITDATGHTVDAALLATLLLGGLRNGRRRALDLIDQAQLAHEALAEHAA